MAKLIIADRIGRLGNRLELFSHFMAFALEHNHVIFNPAFCEYSKYFQATRDDLFCRFPNNHQFRGDRLIREVIFYGVHYFTLLVDYFSKAGIISDQLKVITLDSTESCDLDDPKLVTSIHPDQIVLFRGWEFRVGATNFTKHGDAIRAYFTPLEVYRLNVARLIDAVRQSCDVLVGVHIRQGDYKKFMGGKFFYLLEDYQQLMRQVRRLFPGQRIGFLICSDLKLRAEFFSELNSFFGSGHLIEDMYALAKCDYIMGPPSTFTSWASFYGQVPLYRIHDLQEPVSLKSFETYMKQALLCT